MKRLFHAALAFSLISFIGCHPGPIIDTGPKPPADGTIAGIVSTDSKIAVPTRKVTAINTATRVRYDTTTGPNGGYTIKVPEGTYRLEVELRPGERLVKEPGETRVNKSDVDSGRDFVITVGRAG